MHLLLFFFLDLIATRQFNYNISKDEKANINYILFTFIFYYWKACLVHQ